MSKAETRFGRAVGFPATCRPDAFRSNTERFFPLLEEEKQILLKLYPPTWKGAQTN